MACAFKSCTLTKPRSPKAESLYTPDPKLLPTGAAGPELVPALQDSRAASAGYLN